jgi:hypothetical protein
MSATDTNAQTCSSPYEKMMPPDKVVEEGKDEAAAGATAEATEKGQEEATEEEEPCHRLFPATLTA